MNQNIPKICLNCQGELIVTNPNAKRGSQIRCYLCSKISTLQEVGENNLPTPPPDTQQNVNINNFPKAWVSIAGVIVLFLGMFVYVGFKKTNKHAPILVNIPTTNQDTNRSEIQNAEVKTPTNTPQNINIDITTKPPEDKYNYEPKENEQQIEYPSPEILPLLQKDKWLKFLWSERSRYKVTVKRQNETNATILYAQEERTVVIELLPQWLQEIVKQKFYEEGVKNESIRIVNGQKYDIRTDKNWVIVRGSVYQVLENDGGYLIQINSTETSRETFFNQLGRPVWVNSEWKPILVKLICNDTKIGLYEKQNIKIKALFIGNQGTYPTYDSGVAIGNYSQSRSSGPKRSDQTGSSGSGFFITSDGFFISNHHVVESAKEIEVIHNSITSKARIIISDKKNDIALLKVNTQHPLSWLNIGNASKVKEGEEVGTFGYPLTSLQGVNPKFSKGVIASLTGIDDDLTNFQISVPVQPGNSGGPLFQMATGTVIGIVSSRLKDEVAYGQSGFIPQNVNYAVKINYALSLIESRKEIVLKPALININNQESIISHIKNSIGRVLAYHE